MRLNGWKRIGIVLSCLWFPIGFFWANLLWIDENGGPWVDLYKSCLKLSPQDCTKCQANFDRNYTEAVSGHWWAAIAGAVIPILLGWLLVWAAVKICRWIQAGGFK